MSRHGHGSSYEVDCFRHFLKRLGFKPSCHYDKEVNRYVWSFYDPVDDKCYCRSYSLDDMRCITTASNIFWRFIK